jgi:hypothetical protein
VAVGGGGGGGYVLVADTNAHRILRVDERSGETEVIRIE